MNVRYAPYPTDHELASSHVLKVVSIFRDSSPSDDDIVASLVADGLHEIDAWLLALFVPSAFAWAILKKMGVSSFPNSFVVSDDDGNDVSIPVAQEHYFTGALQIANDVMQNGYNDLVTKHVFTAIISRSAEIGAVNQLLDAGHDIAEASILPLRINNITAQPSDTSMMALVNANNTSGSERTVADEPKTKSFARRSRQHRSGENRGLGI